MISGELEEEEEEEISKLKEQSNEEVALHRSGQLARSLFDLGLVERAPVDDLPVVIGDSKRLFDGHACLELADLKTVGDDGVIVNVCRVYQMSIGNGEWKLWREGEPFNQRFTATISEDGNRIKGRWEYDDGDGWRTDFDLVYTRVR